MMAELGWSTTFVFAGFSISLLVGGIVSKPVARFIERRGGRLTLTMGSLVGAFGLAMLSQVNDPIVYIAAWIVLGLASRLTLYDAAFAMLVEIYGMRARRPISVLTLFGGLASSIFWPITHYLNEAIGWRGAWLVCALAVLVLCTPLHLLLPRLGTPIGGAEGEAAQPDPEPLVPADQKAFAVLMLTIAMAGNSFITTALSVHLIPAVVSMGMAAPWRCGSPRCAASSRRWGASPKSSSARTSTPSSSPTSPPGSWSSPSSRWRWAACRSPSSSPSTSSSASRWALPPS